MIVFTPKEWTPIRNRIKQDYAHKPSVMLIRDSMKRELGFTVREHRVYSEQRGSELSICLDFYDESMETLFRLKYL